MASAVAAREPTTWDAIADTDAERRCLAALRSAAAGTGTDSAMEAHTLRYWLLAERLAVNRSLLVDAEVLRCSAILHDIGIYDRVSRGGVYVSDGAAFARELLAPFAWSAERLRLCLNAIERHHELRPQWNAGPEVELLRRADLIEISGGLFGAGLEGAEIRAVFAAVPRHGFYRAVGKLVAGVARDRPLSLPRIFVRA
jgi:HD domain